MIASKAAFIPKMFLAPVSGLSFLKSGASAFGDGLKPTWPRLAATPASAQIATTGMAAIATCMPTVMNSSVTPLRLTTSGEDTKLSTPSVASSIRRIMAGPKADSASTAAISTIAPLASCERATWPLARASWRFLGVAFSVLFSAMASRPP